MEHRKCLQIYINQYQLLHYQLLLKHLMRYNQRLIIYLYITVFHFVADMASSYENALCNVFFTEERDSLSFDWAKKLPSKRLQYVWLNCPYSNPMPWVKQAAKAQLNGLGVVMLLNDDTSVGWFAEALKTVSEIRHIVADETLEGKREYSSGRIGFINGEGKSISGNNKPQFVLVFNPFKVGSRVTSYVTKNELYGRILHD